jgi:hypothetical protein
MPCVPGSVQSGLYKSTLSKLALWKVFFLSGLKRGLVRLICHGWKIIRWETSASICVNQWSGSPSLAAHWHKKVNGFGIFKYIPICSHVPTYSVARWYIFKPKPPIWVNFGRSCDWECWYFLWPFCLFYGQMVYVYVFYGHFVHFVVIWYSFPVLLCYTEKPWQPCLLTWPYVDKPVSCFYSRPFKEH